MSPSSTLIVLSSLASVSRALTAHVSLSKSGESPRGDARRRRGRQESGSRTSACSNEKPKLSRTKRQSGGGGWGGEVDKTTERSGSFVYNEELECAAC